MSPDHNFTESDMSRNVPTPISEAVTESAQDWGSIMIVVVGPNKDFYIPRDAAKHRSGAWGGPRNHATEGLCVLRRLQWSVEETCKFASAEVVFSKMKPGRLDQS